MIMRFILFALFVSTQFVFARPGTEEPVHPNYRDYNTIIGLCTANQNNDKNHYFKSGHCKTIWETLTKKGDPENCVAKLVEKLRLRVVGDDESLKKLEAMGVKEPKGLSLGFTCESKNNTGEEDNRAIAKDSTKFSTVLMQLFASIAIQESKWKVNEGGSIGQDRSVKCETRCGLLGINKADMEKPEYKCGCEIPNKTDDQRQFDPTMDGHLNLRCGITMALTEALKDKDASSLIGGGKPKGPNQPKDERTGMAKIFRSLESKDDPTGKDKVDTPIEEIEAKMTTYCQTEAFAKRNNKELQEKLNENKQANPILPGVGDAVREN